MSTKPTFSAVITSSKAIRITTLIFQWLGMILAVTASIEFYYSFALVDFLLLFFGLHVSIESHQLWLTYLRKPWHDYNAAVKDVNRLPRKIRRAIIRDLNKK
jgi:hypothetical protein